MSDDQSCMKQKNSFFCCCCCVRARPHAVKGKIYTRWTMDIAVAVIQGEGIKCENCRKAAAAAAAAAAADVYNSTGKIYFYTL